MGKYAELTYVKETATGQGRNDILTMEELDNGQIKITEGRVGMTYGRHKPRVSYYPAGMWDELLEKKKVGRIVTKTKKMDRVEINKKSTEFAEIEDPAVSEFVREMLENARQAFEESYSVKVDNISPEMIEMGADILEKLSNDYDSISVADFNNRLRLLFAVIPRKMDKLSACLAKDKKDFLEILIKEQDTFDVMVAHVKNQEASDQKNQTILEANGIEVRPVTEDEEAFIKKMLRHNSGKYNRAFRVTNHENRKAFDEFVEVNALKKDGITRLFHGTKNENVWSILTTGLKNRPPEGVSICGKAYGWGTYFAPDAQKSLGYTSRWGAKWTQGGSDQGILMICAVATGTKDTMYNGSGGCNSSLDWGKLQSIKPGAFCTWAEARYSGFMMDEVIVYQDSQSTIEYIIVMDA